MGNYGKEHRIVRGTWNYAEKQKILGVKWNYGKEDRIVGDTWNYGKGHRSIIKNIEFCRLMDLWKEQRILCLAEQGYRILRDTWICWKEESIPSQV